MPPFATLLPRPYPYVVPGGRFREVYYWDSYFTMLGLEQSGKHTLAVDILKDFAFEIDRYAHIPNGNRSYSFEPLAAALLCADGAANRAA